MFVLGALVGVVVGFGFHVASGMKAAFFKFWLQNPGDFGWEPFPLIGGTIAVIAYVVTGPLSDRSNSN